jgi:hypothetical protein
MPVYNFPRYLTALALNSVVYGRSILDFDKSYYKNTIRMVDGGSVHEVYAEEPGERETTHTRKKARLASKENVPA